MRTSATTSDSAHEPLIAARLLDPALCGRCSLQPTDLTSALQDPVVAARCASATLCDTIVLAKPRPAGLDFGI